MSRTLVFLEHHAGGLQKASLGVLGKAASLGDLGVEGGAAGDEGSKTEVYELGDPPPRGDSRKIEDDGSAAQQIVDFLAEKRLV